MANSHIKVFVSIFWTIFLLLPTNRKKGINLGSYLISVDLAVWIVLCALGIWCLLRSDVMIGYDICYKYYSHHGRCEAWPGITLTAYALAFALASVFQPPMDKRGVVEEC